MPNVPNFDNMPSILKKRDEIRRSMYKVTGEILYADTIEALNHAVEQIKLSDSLSVKVGILYRAEGHTTPVFVEKVVDDDKDEIFIYNTDSTALDIDAADTIRKDLQTLSRYGQVYSLAYEDPTQEIMHGYKRQHDKESCATISLIDLENMLRENFGEFARNHSVATQYHNIFTLVKLPASFMYITQSVEGKEEYGEKIRKGLKGFVQDEPAEARKPIKIFNNILSLSEIMRDKNLYSFLNEILLATSLDGEVGGLLVNKLKKASAESKELASAEIEIANHKASISKLYAFLSAKQLKNHIVAMHNAVYFGWSDVFDNETKKLAAKNLSDDDVFSLAQAQDREIEIEKRKREVHIFNVAIIVGLIICMMENKGQIYSPTAKSIKFPTLPRKPFWAKNYDDSTLEMAKSAFGQASHTASKLVKTCSR